MLLLARSRFGLTCNFLSCPFTCAHSLSLFCCFALCFVVLCCQSDEFNPKRLQFPWVHLSEDWLAKGIEAKGMTPLQYSVFYVLAEDGKTPAARVVFLAGQDDKIDLDKLREAVNPSKDEKPFDALKHNLTIGIDNIKLTRYKVPKVWPQPATAELGPVCAVATLVHSLHSFPTFFVVLICLSFYSLSVLVCDAQGLRPRPRHSDLR